MSLLQAFWHLLGFCLPAIFVGVSLPYAHYGLQKLFKSDFLKSNKPIANKIHAQAAINFIVCLSVLAAGLVITGRDGKMMTYLAMVLASGLTQWVVTGAWRIKS